MSVFRVALVGHINGSDETRNIFTFDDGGFGLPSGAEVVAWLQSLYTIGVLAVISDDWSSERFIIEEPDGAGHWEYRSEGTYELHGTGGGDTLPQQSAYVVIGVTPSRRRGKKFIAGIPELLQDGGRLGATALTNLQDYANAYVLPMTVGAGEAPSGVCRADGSDFLAFSSGRVDQIVGSQRRRKQGLGS